VSSRLDRRSDWEKLAAQCDYRVEELARVCKVSRRQLYRFFLLRFGKNPKQWLSDVRAKAAAQDIARGELMKTVSSNLKFKDPANFTRFYKRLQGTTPHKSGQKSGDVAK